MLNQYNSSIIKLLQEIKCLVRITVHSTHPSSENLSVIIPSIEYIQLPAGVFLKQVQWLIKFIRQSYYDIDHQYVYNVQKKYSSVTFPQLVYFYILEKVGLQTTALKIMYTLLVTLEFHAYESTTNRSEIFLFYMLISGQLNFDVLFFAKYCRSLFPLDKTSLTTQSLSACTELHLYTQEYIIEKLLPIFVLDKAASKQFIEKQYTSADDAIFSAVAYNVMICREQTLIIQSIFDSNSENGVMLLDRCLEVLKKLNQYLTIERLKEIVNDVKLDDVLFYQLYKQLLTHPADSLRCSIV